MGDDVFLYRHFLPLFRVRCLALSAGALVKWVTIGVAQSDSAFLLSPVDVIAPVVRSQPAGSRVERLDSAQLSWHLSESAADVLLRRSGFYVRSYGLGSLATTSARGGGSAQTAVLWNGLPLQSPMLGQLDFSLLPVLFVDELAVQYGGSSAAWGSGAVGGALLLNNSSRWSPGLSLSVREGRGSFGWQQRSGTLRYGRRHWAASTRLFAEEAQNDFSFRAAPTLPYRRQTNARLQQQGVLQEIFLRPRSEGATLSLRVWWQNTFRQIPPTITQRRSQAEQTDALLRTSAHWRKALRHSVWELRAAYFDESIRYRDALSRQDTRNAFQTGLGEAELTRRFGKYLDAQLVLNCSHTRATTPAYGTSVVQRRTALYSAWQWQGRRLRAQVDGRLEWIDGRRVPFTPSIGMEGQLSPHGQLQARLARHYRAPTLNDRYWRPGGNPSLRPEQGWSQEIGATYRRAVWKGDVALSATAFHRHIYDWILWARRQGQLFFSPQNIAEVRTRGLEARLGLRQSFLAKGQMRMSIGYDHVRSTNERPVVNPRIEAGTQLFYVPKHQMQAELWVQWDHLQVVVFHEYTDAVIGLNETVSAFRLGTLRLQYARDARKAHMLLFLCIENAWDAHYQVVERRPMPGRHFRAGIQAGLCR